MVGAGATIASRRGDVDRAVIGALLGGAVAAWFVGFFGWLWSLGSVTNASLKPEQRLRTFSLNLASGYVIAYGALLIGSFSWSRGPFQVLPLSMILSLHVIAIIASVIVIAFVSRNLVVSRYGRWRTVPWLVTSLLLWAYPIGVWVIQPWALAIANQKD